MKAMILSHPALYQAYQSAGGFFGARIKAIADYLTMRPGMRVRSRGTVVDKYERRGRQYMVTEYVTEDEHGTPLVRGQFTQMLIPEGTRHAGR